MKGIELIAPTVTIRGAFKQTDRPAITALATTILG
jgi:hypothetical protein